MAHNGFVDEPNPINEAASAAGNRLADNLYKDTKQFLISLPRWLNRQINRRAAYHFESLSELLSALLNNDYNDGDRVRVKCLPSLFGPYLRHEAVAMIIGNSTRQRLGPPIVSSQDDEGTVAMAMVANITSHLSPVGLYPVVSDGITQGYLYPDDSNACGFVGIVPSIEELVPRIPVLYSQQMAAWVGTSGYLTGVLRQIDASLFIECGFRVEDYEAVRQANSVWFIDATTEASRFDRISGEGKLELWGGLYAQGHLEASEGIIPYETYLEAFSSAINSVGFEVEVIRNQAGEQEFLMFGTGIRALISSKVPTYSIHMDAELHNDFQVSRTKFDRITTSVLNNLRTACADSSVDLKNPNDLDFSYTNSTNAYTILRSMGASQLADPLAIAIKDWHQTRSMK